MDRHIELPSGISICARVEGHGLPLLLVMGIRLQLVHWPQDLCDALVTAGFQVIRFDNRDAGLSSTLDHLGSPRLAQLVPFGPAAPAYTLDDMAEDTFGLMDALELPHAHVVGISMGGMIAQLMALRSPERFRSLSLIMTTAGGIYIPRLDALWGLMGPRVITGPESYADALVRAQQALRGAGSEPFSEAELVRMRAVAVAAWERCPNRSESAFRRQLAAVLNASDRSERLRELRVPTRVIHGACDPLVPPRAGQHLAHQIDGADLHLIRGMGHGLPARFRARIASLVATHALASESTDPDSSGGAPAG
ncbi:MAG: alpha/beta hydrolase [Deltaproteobacteria bacterium]|nr:alpha/beta hydrolase [Deltaproteobacteria bacterium]HCH63500.1 alpha/beta hydrolase [Deltaproteobacteria bacterium]